MSTGQYEQLKHRCRSSFLYTTVVLSLSQINITSKLSEIRDLVTFQTLKDGVGGVMGGKMYLFELSDGLFVSICEMEHQQ